MVGNRALNLDWTLQRSRRDDSGVPRLDSARRHYRGQARSNNARRNARRGSTGDRRSEDEIFSSRHESKSSLLLDFDSFLLSTRGEYRWRWLDVNRCSWTIKTDEINKLDLNNLS